MLKIGKFNRLEVVKKVEFGLYLKADNEEILLPLKYTKNDTKIGDMLDVFIYKDSEDRLIATSLKPKGVVGEFACLKAVDAANIGAFLDWGLEKDLFVPKNLQKVKIQKDKNYVVMIKLDESTDRIIADTNVEKYLSKDTKKLQKAQEVELLVHRRTPLGALVIVDNKYEGLIYENDLYFDLKIGQKLKGYIKNIRPDGKLDISLKSFGEKAVDEDTQKILNTLKSSINALKFNYKSSPEDIKKVFQMSRKAFKRGLTQLVEKEIIEVSEEGIKLK